MEALAVQHTATKTAGEGLTQNQFAAGVEGLLLIAIIIPPPHCSQCSTGSPSVRMRALKGSKVGLGQKMHNLYVESSPNSWLR